METAHIENVLDHTKGADFMDTAAYYNDPLSGLDYLQYPPHSPFGVTPLGREYPSASLSPFFSHAHLFLSSPPDLVSSWL